MQTSDFDPDYNPLVADEEAGFAPRWERAELNGHAAAGQHAQVLRPGGAGGGGHGGGGGGGGASVPATNLATTVAGPSFADTVATTQNKYYTIPPDSSSAVSTGAVLVAVNAEIELFTRSGTNNNTLRPAFDTQLDAIFKQAGTSFAGNAFDPRVLYDPNSHRFIVIAIDQGTSPNHTQLLVAVSSDDRNGPIHSISDFTPVSIDVSNAISGSWADFPQVGLDNAGHVYVTANMFSFSSGAYTGTRMWVIDENAPGSASSIASHDANDAATDLFSMAPSLMQSSADSGDYLVSYNSATNTAGHNVLNVVHVTSAGAVDRTFQVDLGSHFDASKPYGGLTAPQPGVSQTIDADDSRTAQAVYLNGHLYVAASTLPASGPDAGHTTVHWWEIDTSSRQLLHEGTVSGNTAHPGSGLRSYYASLAVSPDEHTLAISFTGSGPTSGVDTAGRAYTGNASAYVMEVDLTPSGGPIPIQQVDPNTHLALGTWALVESGKDSYYRTFGGADNRWGDYSSISADPANPGHFWAFNEYADQHGSVLVGYANQNGQWATELGYI